MWSRCLRQAWLTMPKPSILTYFKRHKKDTSDGKERDASEKSSHLPVPPTCLHEASELPSTSMLSSSSSVVDSEHESESVSSAMSIDVDVEPESEDVQSTSTSTISRPTSSATSTTFFANKRKPHRPHLKSYPKKKQSGVNRSFNPQWYESYEWLEYCEELNACFCFACRVFLPISKEKVFTSTGFSDWKHALCTGKAIIGHNGTKGHEHAMALWAERTEREKDETQQVQNQIISIVSEHKQWVFAVFNVVRYLSANGLPFRGDTEHDIDTGDGLFRRAFSQLIFELDPKLKDIYKRLPKNAKYISPDIQNEIIEIMAKLVKKNVADKVREAGLFTIMADGTTDKNRKEIQGLVFRYLSKSSGKVEEHCLNIKGVDDRSANGVFDFIKKTFTEFELSFDGLVSQSYDGASVMSGAYNGLQRLISDFCGRFVLYVHCFLHKINLVVVHVMENISEIKEYFEIISSLYKFFKKSAVLEAYDGTALKRLIITRWSGHHDSTNHVNNNYGDLIKALRLASNNKKLKSEDRALALGLLHQMDEDEDFVFVNCMLMQVLKPINIVVKQLQSPGENLSSAVGVINSTREQMICIREDLTEEKLETMVKQFLDVAGLEKEQQRRPQRSKTLPPHFNEFLVTEHIPAENNPRSHVAIFAECLDVIEQEFARRFSTENIQLWQAMEALSPDSASFLNSDVLIPFLEYAQSIPMVRDFISKNKLSIDDLHAECRIFARLFKDKVWPRDNSGRIDIVDVALLLRRNHESSAAILLLLYTVAITAGFTSTRVECLFSSLTRVDTPQRRSMKTDREVQLAYLAFENKLLSQVSFDDFLQAWMATPKTRKLFL